MSSTILLTTTFLCLGNTVFFHSPWLGILSLMALFLASGRIFGKLFFPNQGKIIYTTAGTIFPLAIVVVIGSIFFYLYKLNLTATIITLLCVLVLTLLAERLNSKISPEEKINDQSQHKTKTIYTIPAAISLAGFLIIAFRFLAHAGTIESIRSPWQVLPWQFFLVVFLAAASLIVLALAKSRLTLAATVPFFFLFFSITNFIYPLGYGFDPFIHQATEKYIAAHSTITPKPFTYIGQYALVKITHDITATPIESVDRLLLPLVLAIFLPVAGWLAFKNYLAAVLLTVLPISTFAATTPQGLANTIIFIILLLAIALRDSSKYTLISIWLLGFAALVIHPLAGAPILIFLITYSLLHREKTSDQKQNNAWLSLSPDFNYYNRKKGKLAYDLWKLVLIIFTTVLGSFIIPFLFIVFGLINKTANIIKPDILSDLFQIFGNFVGSLGFLDSRFNIFLDFVYFYNLNLIILLILSVVTVFIFLRQHLNWILPLVLSSVVITINGLITLAAIDFSFLPFYEQSGYAERLFDLAKLFLLPIFLIILVVITKKIIEKKSLIVNLGVVALLAGLITSSLYLTYPHNDAYVTERGLNVSKYDFEAVRFINQDAAGAPTIVLANQMVSVAALNEFGFKNYYRIKTEDGKEETVFYYPIPTGSALYNYFLRMSYEEPRRTTIADAAERTGVHLGYFVVNSYWWKAEELVERAKREADSWQSFGNGKVFVFKFENL